MGGPNLGVRLHLLQTLDVEVAHADGLGPAFVVQPLDGGLPGFQTLLGHVDILPKLQLPVFSQRPILQGKRIINGAGQRSPAGYSGPSREVGRDHPES